MCWHTELMYLDVSVRQQQVDDDVDWKALHVVQTLLDAAQLGRQLRAGVQLPSLTDLIQDRLTEILTVTEENTPEGKVSVFMRKQCLQYRGIYSHYLQFVKCVIICLSLTQSLIYISDSKFSANV